MTDASSITRTLGGKWHGRYGTAPCPVCQPEGRRDQDALTLADGGNGRLLAHCKKSGCDFTDILAAASVAGCGYAPPDQLVIAQREAEHRAEAEKRQRQALALWREARPIGGTVAERYLRGRGITCDLPESLRFHPACWHPSAKRFPALVARVDGAERFAVHRTYLRDDGSGKAQIEPAKAMLGTVAGGAVRLTEAQGSLAVAEGIETALSLTFGLLRAPAAIWAALSTSGMRAVQLPPEPGRLTIAPDGDDAGRNAAIAPAERAHALGWQVSLLPAPKGCDWNDVLTMKGNAA
ncbi:toprim domain-containing protein [Tropicimonas sp. IMCC6043]|uniref:DUF7146 domain-containing protein n=1 Tax=Tropicimonas sp. IMCC6043 TaxID=2510645 RepID=UPI00101C679E|nr:toprim domain-containing protein [Tropicimonas sp. IMCC6043]RYH07745.1 hypothetical protein EU800_19200 [Tropicimonas sp. IMCC6043]